MADEELIITARNEEFVRKLNECQRAIQETKREMEDLQKQGMKPFSDINKLNEYTKNLDDTKKKLADLNTEEKKLIGTQEDLNDSTKDIKDEFDAVGSATGGLTKKMGLVAAAVGFAAKVFKDVIQALADTTIGMKTLTQVGEFWKTLTYNIATGNLNMAESFRQAAKTAAMINDVRIKEREDLVEVAKLRKEYNQLYFESADRIQSDSDRLKDLNGAMEKHDQLIAKEIEQAKEQLTIVQLQRVNRFHSNKLMDEEAKLKARIIDIEGRSFSETRRLESQRTGLEEKIAKDKRDKLFENYYTEIELANKAKDEQLKIQQEYQQLSEKLLQDYDNSQIESLSGIEKLKAQRDFGIKQIKEIRDRLAELGTITPEQMAMLEGMGNNVWKAYYKGFAEEAKRVTPKQREEITKALLGDMPELPGLQKMTQNTAENIQKSLESNKAMEEFSVWKLMGIDTDSDEGQQQIEAIQEMSAKLKDALDSTLQMRVDNAERQRELLDTQISELQNEIDLEAELMEEGFANNLTAKQKELDELKKQREKALAEEEKALKQQQSFDRISQAISLATSVANILKSFTKLGPLGLVLAAGAVASLWAIWAGAKAKAAQTSKLAEGGSGTERGLITGKRHYQGGERFLDHVEVERGEAFGVLSRGATEKYGNIFHEMVSSFNKDAMPDFIAPAVSNSIRVENNGPNSRLDKVIKEQQRLNESLTKQSQLYSTGNKRIIKNGNKIRIIG